MSLMRVPTLLLLLALLSLPIAVQAQFAAYGTYQVTQVRGVSYNSPSGNGVKGSFTPLGGTFGLYYDFHSFGPVRLGADLRGTILKSTRGVDPNSIGGGGHIGSALGGVRAVFRTPIASLKPYVQGSVGIARTDYGIDYYQQIIPTNVAKYAPGVTLSTALQYQGFVGLDIKLLPIMDVRLIELGIGSLKGSGTHSGNYPLDSIGIGVVFHLPVQ